MPLATLETMRHKAPSKHAEIVLSPSGFVCAKNRYTRPSDWRKKALKGAWNNLVWNWRKLRISASGRKAADSLELVPSEVFAHPDMIYKHPELADYYRLMAFLPKKGPAKISFDPGQKETLAFCRFVNRYLSCLVTAAAKASRQTRINPVFAVAGKKQGQWERHSHRFDYLTMFRCEDSKTK
jgi:hypothetical protein